MPPGKLAYPKRRTSGYGSMLPTRLFDEACGAGKQNSGRVWQLEWQSRQQKGLMEIGKQELPPNGSQSGTVRMRVVVRNDRIRDDPTVGEGNQARDEKPWRTLPGRGRVVAVGVLLKTVIVPETASAPVIGGNRTAALGQTDSYAENHHRWSGERERETGGEDSRPSRPSRTSASSVRTVRSVNCCGASSGMRQGQRSPRSRNPGARPKGY